MRCPRLIHRGAARTDGRQDKLARRSEDVTAVDARRDSRERKVVKHADTNGRTSRLGRVRVM